MAPEGIVEDDSVDIRRIVEVEPMLRYFDFDHLQHEKLREVSSEFHTLALFIVNTLPRTPERTVALRKLLESKDAAVRAALDLR